MVKLVDYEKDVENEAREFLAEHDDMIKEALKEGSDFNYNDIRDLDSAWHEGIVDRSYSASDAVFILENCDSEETDSGLWEGLTDWREQLSARAAYSYANDVWAECRKIYDEMKDELERRKDARLEQKGADAELEDEEVQAILDEVFKENTETKPEPVEQGSQQEKELIERWLRLNAGAGLWGGYNVGDSYIDARCGSGHGMPEVKDYVDFDRELSQRVPHLSGKSRKDVQEYYDKVHAEKPKRKRNKKT